MTGILGILGTILFAVRIVQMGKSWWRKRKYQPELTKKPRV